MWLRGKIAVLAAFVALTLAPAAGYGQAGPTPPPPRETAPDAGTVAPDVPEGRPRPRVLPVPPDVLPPAVPGMGGRDCESERAPGIGV